MSIPTCLCWLACNDIHKGTSATWFCVLEESSESSPLLHKFICPLEWVGQMNKVASASLCRKHQTVWRIYDIHVAILCQC